MNMAFQCETCQEYKPESKRYWKQKNVCSDCIYYRVNYGKDKPIKHRTIINN